MALLALQVLIAVRFFLQVAIEICENFQYDFLEGELLRTQDSEYEYIKGVSRAFTFMFFLPKVRRWR